VPRRANSNASNAVVSGIAIITPLNDLGLREPLRRLSRGGIIRQEELNMAIWTIGFSTHIRFLRREVIITRRWREARQIGIGFANLDNPTGRVRWVFLTGYKLRGFGW
jgi:hypothetical protein